MIKHLAKTYEGYFPIGAAVSPYILDTHKQLICDHFSSLTAENQMKPILLHPREDLYTFESADIIANFAADNKMLLRGHTLVWHNQTPKWFFTEGDGETLAKKEQVMERLKSHTNEVMGRYHDKIYAWDVVNEAISDNPNDAALRDSPWKTALGDNYIEHAFRIANEADPNAKLFYNDYNECDPVKSQKIFNLVKSLQQKGVPIDGIGLQGHWNIYDPDITQIKRAIELYATLGVKLEITELDISLFRFNDGTVLAQPSDELLEKQAERYDKIFSLLREYKDLFSNITLWGVADDVSWLSDFPFKNRKNWPLLFDDIHCPKKAFERIVNF